MLTHTLLAYIDPVTGALLLQGLLAGILTVGVGFRKTFVNAYRKLSGKKADTPTGEGSPDAATAASSGEE